MNDDFATAGKALDIEKRYFVRFGEMPDSRKSKMWNAPNVYFTESVGRELPGLSVYEVQREGDRWELLTDDINVGSGMASLLALFERAQQDSAAKIYLLEGTANSWSTLTDEEKEAYEDFWLGENYEDHDLLGTDGEPLLRSFQVIEMLSLRDLVCAMISYPEDWEDAQEPDDPADSFTAR